MPSVGPYSGGTPITVNGQFLAGATAVTVGGVPCTNVVSVSSTQVTAVTPAGSVGSADVVVTCAKGAVTAAGAFTYLSVVTPSWATLIEALPDPAVVTDPALRAAIAATGLAWRVRDTGTGIEMLLVPPGAFQMGCVMGSTMYGCDGNAEPVHGVAITRPFYLGRFEVTQAQWAQAMGANPAFFRDSPDSAYRPVESVSWIAVQGFLATTSFRLPTEAEWEFACRAGTDEPFHNGLTADDSVSDIAWCAPLADTRTYAVGGKSPNMLGFHDMLGNVWELVADWYAEYRPESQLDPTGPASGSFRLRRGGSWAYGSSSARSYYRNAHGVEYLSWDFGLRVARNP